MPTDWTFGGVRFYGCEDRQIWQVWIPTHGIIFCDVSIPKYYRNLVNFLVFVMCVHLGTLRCCNVCNQLLHGACMRVSVYAVAIFNIFLCKSVQIPMSMCTIRFFFRTPEITSYFFAFFFGKLRVVYVRFLRHFIYTPSEETCCAYF